VEEEFCPGSFGIVIVVLREGGPYSRKSSILFVTVSCVRNEIDDSVQHGHQQGRQGRAAVDFMVPNLLLSSMRLANSI
jgi:hypothetical protein